MTHGFSCAYRIEDIAHHLAAVFDLVEHYRARARPRTNTCCATSPWSRTRLAETRRLLDYLGLPFEEACLRFHENRRYAPTPSYAQVAEPLTDRAIGRHQHYAAAAAAVTLRSSRP